MWHSRWHNWTIQKAKNRITHQRNSGADLLPQGVSLLGDFAREAEFFRVYDDSFQNGFSRGGLSFDGDALVFGGRIDPSNFRQNFEAPTVQVVRQVA